MATHAQLAARLLRDSAKVFRSFGEQTPSLTEALNSNADTFEMVADLVEKDPMGEVPELSVEKAD